MKILSSFIRRPLIAAGRDLFAPRAVERRETLPDYLGGVSLHMVVGHDMLRMGLLSLRSFEFHTRYRWSPLIHDDGTLDAGDLALLQHHFPDAVVITRSRADQEVPVGLADFPACRDHRMKHHWFLKVFDTRHYAPGHRYIIIDSDIIFFRRPDAVLDWLTTGSEAMRVMEDDHEKYSHSRQTIEEQLGLKLLPRANSGLDLMPKNAADLALADRFLATCADSATQYPFLEQTIFAIWVSARAEGRLLPREQYEISWNNFRRRAAVCRHYIGPAKNDALYVEGATSFWWQSCVQTRLFPQR